MALKKAIEMLIADASLREHLAERAQTRALEFDITRFAGGYLDVYSEAMSLRRAECVS
jgi:hypothetical protein